MTFRGLRAVVTGASSGLGRRVAERLADEGVEIALLGRDSARLEAVAAACRAAGVRTHAAAGDIADEQYVVRACNAAADALGPIDIVVNCAGLSLSRRLAVGDVPLAIWHEMQQANVRGTFLVCNHVVPMMRQRGHGTIINIGSTGSHVALPGVSAYAASKFAVRALTEAMAQECDGTGVRVCLVSSGPIDTPLWDKRSVPPSSAEREAMLRPDDVVDAILWLIARPKGVRIDEILLRPVRSIPIEI